MWVQYKYIWRGVNLEKDIKLFAEILSKTPNLKLKKLNKTTKKFDILDSYDCFEHMFDEEAINKNYILSHTTNYGEYDHYIEFNIINFEKSLLEGLEYIIYEAHEFAKKIKREGFYGEITKGSVASTVYGLLSKWDYNKELTIIDVFAELVYRITNAHIFKNGNKRTALISLILFAQNCGLFLKYTNYEDYLNYWENFMINISQSKYTECEAIKNIKNILMDNVYIGYTRYNNLILKKK